MRLALRVVSFVLMVAASVVIVKTGSMALRLLCLIASSLFGAIFLLTFKPVVDWANSIITSEAPESELGELPRTYPDNVFGLSNTIRSEKIASNAISSKPVTGVNTITTKQIAPNAIASADLLDPAIIELTLTDPNDTPES